MADIYIEKDHAAAMKVAAVVGWWPARGPDGSRADWRLECPSAEKWDGV